MFDFGKLEFIAQIQICIMGLCLNFMMKGVDCATQVLHMNETFLFYLLPALMGVASKLIHRSEQRSRRLDILIKSRVIDCDDTRVAWK